MRAILFMVAAALSTAACDTEFEQDGGSHDPIQEAAARLHLSLPLTMPRVSYYEDGGTLGFALVDARGETLCASLDGRGNERCPPPFYLGALYPTEEHALLLPIYGEIERAVVLLATETLRDSLAPQDWEYLRHYIGSRGLPDTVSVSLWHAVMLLEWRRSTLEAWATGHVESVENALRWFKATPPVRIQELSVSDQGQCIRVTLKDGSTNSWTIRIERDTSSLLPTPIRLESTGLNGEPYVYPLSRFGCEERNVLTLLSLAIEGSREAGLSLRLLPDLAKAVEQRVSDIRTVASVQ